MCTCVSVFDSKSSPGLINSAAMASPFVSHLGGPQNHISSMELRWARVRKLSVIFSFGCCCGGVGGRWRAVLSSSETFYCLFSFVTWSLQDLHFNIYDMNETCITMQKNILTKNTSHAHIFYLQQRLHETHKVCGKINPNQCCFMSLWMFTLSFSEIPKRLRKRLDYYISRYFW